jgi:multiple sugar transport system permease protein
VSRGREAIPFILPLILFVSLFMLLPVVGTFWLSLWQDITFLPKRFIGLLNYLRLLGDNQFWQATIFTLFFSFVSVTIELVMGLIIALLINENFRFRSLTRGIVLLPWAIPSIISARAWQLLYHYDYGLFNYILERVFGFQINWLGQRFSAFISLVVADTWRTTPFVAIILLAGLQIIPQDIYKQARVDGAGLWARFSKITLPLLKPLIVVALLFRTIDALRVFDIIYVITAGGPAGSTISISLYGYNYFLAGDFGYGTCVSFVLFIFAFCLSLLYIKIGRFRETVL